MALVINGQKIDDALVESEFGSIKAYHESLGNVSCCERDPEFRAGAGRTWSARVLLAQEAGRGVDPTPEAELDAAVEKLKEEYGGEGWFFARTGATAETMHLVRRDVDLDLRVRRLLQDLGDEGGPPTEPELRRFYERAPRRIQDGRGGPGVAHPQDGPGRARRGAEGREQAYDQLRQVRRELLAGGDFDALAKLHSEKADEHIDLGFFKRNELAPEFEAVAFSMEVGRDQPGLPLAVRLPPDEADRPPPGDAAAVRRGAGRRGAICSSKTAASGGRASWSRNCGRRRRSKRSRNPKLAPRRPGSSPLPRCRGERPCETRSSGQLRS